MSGAGLFFVEIVERKTGEIVERMGPMREREAERTNATAGVNLDHADYLVRTVPDTGSPKQSA